ncbi:MAG TPA: hypothetical protein PLV85_15125, partial [Polyangiaceae bacterium]|nr:hypothetical protein [Polyangiaceae bacterium]
MIFSEPTRRISKMNKRWAIAQAFDLWFFSQPLGTSHLLFRIFAVDEIYAVRIAEIEQNARVDSSNPSRIALCPKSTF